MKKHLIFSVAAMSAMLSTTALAETPNAAAKKLGDNSYVTISGVVDSVDNEREFTVRDASGTIDVDLAAKQSVVLKKGQHVTVSGIVDNDMGFVDVDATNVYVHKGLNKTVSDAVKSIPGISTSDAQAFNIKSLPNQGIVKISGTVTDVDNEKEFTLKDKTGSIDVDVASDENVILRKGAEVTVIGMVDSGVLGKDINATNVIVIADTQK
jgi:uncharacterized protein YdeI (BOF family)